MVPNPSCCKPTNSVKISATISMALALFVIVMHSWMIKNAASLHEIPFKVQYIEFRNEFNYLKYKSRDFVRRLAENVIFTATEALRDPEKFNPEEQLRWSVQRALAVKQGDQYLKQLANVVQVIKYFPLGEEFPRLFQDHLRTFLLTFELPNFEEMERVSWVAGFLGLMGGSIQLVSSATLLCSIEKRDKLSAKRWILITFGVVVAYAICAITVFSQDDTNWVYSAFNFYWVVAILGVNSFCLLFFLWIVLAYVQLSEAGKFV